jgi:hypothetical protein
VIWREVEHIGGKGHGVEFVYVSDPDLLVAFLDGFGWLRDPKEPATVEILRKGAVKVPDTVIEEARRAVLHTVQQGAIGARRTGNIIVRANA